MIECGHMTKTQGGGHMGRKYHSVWVNCISVPQTQLELPGLQGPQCHFAFEGFPIKQPAKF